MLDTEYTGADTEGAGSLSSVVESLWKAEVSDLTKRQESCMDSPFKFRLSKTTSEECYEVEVTPWKG